MKKLYYITNSRIPTEKAHGVNIVYMCEALSKYFDVTLFIPFRHQSEVLKNKKIQDVYDVKPNFKVRIINIIDLIKYDISQTVGYFFHTMIFSLLCLSKIKKEKPDLIYTRQPIEAFFISFINLPFIYELHSNQKFLNRLHKRIFKKARLILPISRGLEETIPKKYLYKTKVLSDSVPKSFIIKDSENNLREKLGLPLNKKIILYTGKLSEEKGVDFLLSVANKLTNYYFVIIGGMTENVKKYQNKYNNSNIKIIGYIPHKNIKYYINAADVLIIPNLSSDNYSSKHTSPIKLYEYLSTNKPILASNVNSLKVSKNIVFFEAENELDFIKKLRTLKNIRKPEIYTWDDRVKQIREFLK